MYIILLIFFLLVVIYLRMQMQKPPNFPPGPLWLPFVGNLPELKKLSRLLGGQHHALITLAKKYKTDVLGLKLGSDYVVTVFSYSHIREVLTSEEYEGRPDNFFLRLRCMGELRGITFTEGSIWSIQRNFVNKHLRNLGFGKTPMEKMIEDEVVEILSVLENDGNNISVNNFLAPGIINVLWTLVSGERIPREENKLNELLDLFKLRSKAFDMTGGILAQYPWLRYIVPEYCGFNLIEKVNSIMKEFFMKTIRKHKESWTEGKNDDLIYRYLSEIKLQTGEAKDFDEDQLIMVCLDLFVAGAQTTSGTLDFAFLMMIMYPDIQKKVQEEIDAKCGDKSAIRYSDRHKIPYTEAVLSEIMRFRHVLPIIGPRRVTKDTYLEGHFLPKNTTVLISLYSVHNAPEHWQNPDVFIPERFLDEQGAFIPTEKLIPFGLGRRRCLGEALAKNCIFTFFVEILRKYDVSLDPRSKPSTEKCLSGITLAPEEYTARFTLRSK